MLRLPRTEPLAPLGPTPSPQPAVLAELAVRVAQTQVQLVGMAAMAAMEVTLQDWVLPLLMVGQVVQVQVVVVALSMVPRVAPDLLERLQLLELELPLLAMQEPLV